VYSWYSPAGDERNMDATPRKGSDTKERILEVAQATVLEKGFAATSIEELIAAVDITKSGFFYHFKDKNELAKALLLRYVEREDALFDDLFRRADELNEDPLHGFLVGLKMMSELMADLPNGHPGCLVASFCYQDRLFDKEVRDLNAKAVLNWRATPLFSFPSALPFLRKHEERVRSQRRAQPTSRSCRRRSPMWS
jgi:TetR/AcrR family transcriptional regulator, transcriptional repressor for nem operon